VIITFLTDFGLQDDFVGTCHGVMKRIAPSADIIDITHGIGAQQILQGALVLAGTLPYIPEGVHLAVVDPGVGTDRKPLALRGGDGRLYVGPDNGLLVPAAERLGGVAAAWALENPTYRLEPVSSTFHGRDVFSPAAAHLAAGVDPAELGPALDPASLVRLDVPVAVTGDGAVRAHVLIVDRFGNIQLNLTREDLSRVGIEPGTRVEVELGLQRFYAAAARTFADVRVGDIVLYEDAYENVALAINAGNAAEMLGAHPGDAVGITVRPGA
jgi:S-adenosyl-L-methionine hydrolase (adenosine-forming)